MAIAPGEAITTEVHYDFHPKDDVELVLHFIDSAGRLWARKVRANEYVSNRTQKRWKKERERSSRELAAKVKAKAAE